MVLVTKFQKQNSKKINNYWHIINLNYCYKQKLFIPSLSILLEDEGQ
jgi:hypothetical protein